MESMISIGTNGEKLKATKDHIISLLKTFPSTALSDQVAVQALVALTTICKVEHVTISNCTLTHNIKK